MNKVTESTTEISGAIDTEKEAISKALNFSKDMMNISDKLKDIAELTKEYFNIFEIH